MMGGLGSNQEELNYLQVFDGVKWSTEVCIISSPAPSVNVIFVMQASLITPRYGACAVIFSNYLIVVGGQRTQMTVENTVEVYSVDRRRWKQLKISGDYLGAISASCAVFHQGERHGKSY